MSVAKQLSFAVMVAVSISAPARGQELLRLASERTVSGTIEMSVGKETPIVFVSIDLPDDKNKYDGNIEAFYVLELEPGVPKPQPLKALGTLVYKQHDSLIVEAGGKRLQFSRLVAKTSSSNAGAMRIVDLVESRRGPMADRTTGHAEMAGHYLPMSHGPFVKKPK